MSAPVSATPLSMWSEERVKVSEVVSVLDELRRPEPMPATRTSVLTLVIVANRAQSVARAHAALAELGGRHPARVLTLLVDELAAQADDGIDAEVRLLGGEADGRAVWFEDVVLTVRGAVTRHLDSLIEPFTLSDLPVVVWFADGLPAVGDPMLAAADVLLVDARDFGDTACFEALSALAERPLVDLSWQRLKPWRLLLASLFEGPSRPFVTGVERATVAGKTGPRHLLGGWLATRLNLRLDQIDLIDAEHVTIELAARAPDGRQAGFEVARRTDDRLVVARATVESRPASEQVVPLPEGTAGWGLADALAHLERDPVYEEALRAAIALAARSGS